MEMKVQRGDASARLRSAGERVKPIERILVATDFSECSERALDAAIDLARSFRASITLLHVCELPVYGLPDGSFIMPAEVSDQLVTGAREALARAVERRRECGVPIAQELREDAPWLAIDAAAESLDADLVVLGTHGRRGFSHAFFGSVAERVVRTCKRPVLTIREAAASRNESCESARG